MPAPDEIIPSPVIASDLSAPQGLNMSSRGQRPPEMPPPDPLPPACGERGSEGGVWGRFRGFHPAIQFAPLRGGRIRTGHLTP